MSELQHYSDCGVYNEPAYPATDCDCGADRSNKWLFMRLLYRFRMWLNDLKNRKIPHDRTCRYQRDRDRRAMEKIVQLCGSKPE